MRGPNVFCSAAFNSTLYPKFYPNPQNKLILASELKCFPQMSTFIMFFFCHLHALSFYGNMQSILFINVESRSDNHNQAIKMHMRCLPWIVILCILCVHVHSQKCVKYSLIINHCVCRFKYQLIVVGGGEVRVSIWNQEQLAVGVDGEETQEVILEFSYKVSYGLGLGLRHRFAPTVDLGAAVIWYPNCCESSQRNRKISINVVLSLFLLFVVAWVRNPVKEIV